MSSLIPLHQTAPTLIASAGERAQTRFVEFFTANVRNPNTRRAYAQAAREFMTWCEMGGIQTIADVQPVHVNGEKMVGVAGFEPATPSSRTRCIATCPLKCRGFS